MAITPLTPDQRDMVADNHNLIYGVLNKHNLCIEDWYGCAAVGLCRAAQSYDPGRGFTFSSYAYAVMLNEIRHHLRAARLGKRTAVVVSLDDPEDPLSIYRVPAAQGEYGGGGHRQRPILRVVGRTEQDGKKDGAPVGVRDAAVRHFQHHRDVEARSFPLGDTSQKPIV